MVGPPQPAGRVMVLAGGAVDDAGHRSTVIALSPEAPMFKSFILRCRRARRLPPPVTSLAILAPEDGPPGCGWFDSSWALDQGLAVSDLPDSDGTVAALWFAQLAPRPGCSAQQA